MPILHVGPLNLQDNSRLEQYEKAMYRAFSSSPVEADGLWLVDHTSRRIATKIPYDKQVIVVADWGGELVAAASVNMDMDNGLQLERFGFCIDREAGKAAEALVLFANKIMVGREILMVRVARECSAILKNNCITVLWASCEKKHVRAYIGAGFVLCEEMMFRGREVYLLRYTL